MSAWSSFTKQHYESSKILRSLRVGAPWANYPRFCFELYTPLSRFADRKDLAPFKTANISCATRKILGQKGSVFFERCYPRYSCRDSLIKSVAERM